MKWLYYYFQKIGQPQCKRSVILDLLLETSLIFISDNVITNPILLKCIGENVTVRKYGSVMIIQISNDWVNLEQNLPRA